MGHLSRKTDFKLDSYNPKSNRLFSWMECDNPMGFSVDFSHAGSEQTSPKTKTVLVGDPRNVFQDGHTVIPGSPFGRFSSASF